MKPSRAAITYGLVLLGSVFGAVSSSWSESELPPEIQKEMDQHIKARNQKNFAGWEGVVFECIVYSAGAQYGNEICRRSTTNAEFLAAAARVKLVTKKNAMEYVKGITGNYLQLQLTLTISEAGSPSAVYGNLRAYETYTDATKSNKHSVLDDQTEIPRQGDLILWERDMLGATSGTGKELISPVSENIELLLKTFFAEYTEARNPAGADRKNLIKYFCTAASGPGMAL